MNKSLGLILSICLASWMSSSETFAQCCTKCGRTCTTRQVCRTIYTTKSVECIEYGEVCEEVCLAPKTLGTACGSCDSCDSADCSSLGCDSSGLGESTGGLSGLTSWFRQLSSCESRPRARLMRKTLIRQVPVVECVTEDVCDICQQTELSTSGILAATPGWTGNLNAQAIAGGTNAPFNQAVQAAPAFYQQLDETKPFFQTVGAEMPSNSATTPSLQPTLTPPLNSNKETLYNYFPLTRQPTEEWVR